MREIAELAFAALGAPPRSSEIPLRALAAAVRVIRPFDLNVAGLIRVMAAPAARHSCCDACGDAPAVRR